MTFIFEEWCTNKCSLRKWWWKEQEQEPDSEPDPDPYQNVTDPEHWIKCRVLKQNNRLCFSRDGKFKKFYPLFSFLFNSFSHYFTMINCSTRIHLPKFKIVHSVFELLLCHSYLLIVNCILVYRKKFVGCWTDSIFIYFRFTHALTSLIGNVMRVETQSYSEYEGIFKCFSGKCEMVLELAHKVIIDWDLGLGVFGTSKILYRTCTYIRFKSWSSAGCVVDPDLVGSA